MKRLFDLIICNWQTTAKAMIPFIIVGAARLGYCITDEQAATILSTVYMILLIFSRDPAKEKA